MKALIIFLRNHGAEIQIDLAVCDAGHSTLPYVQEYLAAVRRTPKSGGKS